jgi:hypothetical protein
MTQATSSNDDKPVPMSGNDSDTYPNAPLPNQSFAPLGSDAPHNYQIIKSVYGWSMQWFEAATKNWQDFCQFEVGEVVQWHSQTLRINKAYLHIDYDASDSGLGDIISICYRATSSKYNSDSNYRELTLLIHNPRRPSPFIIGFEFAKIKDLWLNATEPTER